MRRRFSIVPVLVVLVLCTVFAGSAVAHTGHILSVTCSEVHGTFEDFAPDEHPISFHVSVAGGAFQTVPGVEQPPGFVNGTASADITSLTAVLHGASGNVAAYADWPGGSTSTVEVTVTCGTPPTTTTTTPPTTTTTTPPTTTTTAPPTTTTTTAPPPPAPPPTVQPRPPVQRVVVSPPVPAAPVPVAPATAG
jgi:hypothetical protein